MPAKSKLAKLARSRPTCEGEGAFTVGLNQRFRVRRSVGCAVRVRWARNRPRMVWDVGHTSAWSTSHTMARWACSNQPRVV